MTQSKKILLVSLWSVDGRSVGGTERFIIDLASGLAERGHEVDVLMMTGRNHKSQGVNYYSLNFFGPEIDANEYIYQDFFGNELTPGKLKAFSKRIETLFDASSYDVVQLNSLLFAYLFLGKKRVSVIHTNPYELTLDWGKNAASCLAATKDNLLADDIYIAPSTHYARLYSRIFGRRVETIPHSIDINRLKTKLSRKEVLKKYDIANKYIFLVPSRLDFKQKRPQIALKALAVLKGKIPDFEIVFTGLDSQYAEYAHVLFQRALHYGLDIRIVKFKNIADAYKIADTVILPSQSESFGYSAVEAIALGKRVVLNNIPTFKEIERGSVNVVVFNRTAIDLANKLEGREDSVYHRQSKEWLKRYSREGWLAAYEKVMDD